MVKEKDIMLDYIFPILVYVVMVAAILMPLLGIIFILNIGEVAAWLLIEGMTVFIGFAVQTTTELLE